MSKCARNSPSCFWRHARSDMLGNLNVNPRRKPEFSRSLAPGSRYTKMAVTSIGGRKMAIISKNPLFYSQKWPTKTATKSWRFLLRFGFLFSRFLCLFLLVSPCFLLFHYILESQNSPPNEVTGIKIWLVALANDSRRRFALGCQFCQTLLRTQIAPNHKKGFSWKLPGIDPKSPLNTPQEIH